MDANVLNERIREEMRLGRSLMAAVDMGYQRAMTTIVDSNTLIGAFILYSFGTGPGAVCRHFVHGDYHFHVYGRCCRALWCFRG